MSDADKPVFFDLVAAERMFRETVEANDAALQALVAAGKCKPQWARAQRRFQEVRIAATLAVMELRNEAVPLEMIGAALGGACGAIKAGLIGSLPDDRGGELVGKLMLIWESRLFSETLGTSSSDDAIGGNVSVQATVGGTA